MTEETYKSIPEPTLRRLPSYHRYLKGLAARKRPVVSCSRIGEELGLDPTQVRKDLGYTGIIGTPKVGYPVDALIEAIEEFLGWTNANEGLLVGVGSLGTALLGFERFNTYGLHIVAAFDNDAAKIGTTVHGRDVLPMEKFVRLATRIHALVGIIAVPAEHAQTTANLMMQAGIRAIWNLAPVPLVVPPTVIVQQDDLFASLAVLTQKLSARLKSERV